MAREGKSGRRGRGRRIGLRDRLGRLTLPSCRQMLGEDVQARLRKASHFNIDVANDVYLGRDTFRVTIRDPHAKDGRAIVTMVEMTSRPKGIFYQCDRCETTCEHIYATFGLLLEEKMSLGLSAPPDPDIPLEHLSEEELLNRALAERRERAEQERMLVQSLDKTRPWADYVVTSRHSGKSYRVALRGTELGESYCSCPDFRVNHLGTCKHILNVIRKVGQRFSAQQLSRPYQRRGIGLAVDYGAPFGLKLLLPSRIDTDLQGVVKGHDLGPTTDAPSMLKLVRKLERRGYSVHIYPDAEELIQQSLIQAKLTSLAAEIRQDPAQHPLRRELLKTELLPYQLDGIAFAVGKGRAILADDMGLGKTIQAIGVAELLARFADVRRVLIVTPASLKSQWRNEIGRFCDRTSQVVQGSSAERAAQYADTGAFFKICNYEQVLRDEKLLASVVWDLVVLDEGQRIKNWESKTSRVVKSLKSNFALVLSGTPLENRLEELYSIVSFVDARRLGPAYRFFHRHRMVNDNGRIEGYRNLDELRAKLQPILLRRTRAQVAQQLPERSTELVRIRPTDEQWELSEHHVSTAARIAAKRYLTEMDILQIQKHLMMARMAADSTYLVDKQDRPGYSTKLEYLQQLLAQLSAEEDRKILIFSEWTTMLDLVEAILRENKIQFGRLDGAVPVKQRQMVVQEFQSNPECRAMILSNAGTTGLNLQAANTVINIDLPWNPAVLEQRIGRAHRMGQKRPVQVFILVTEDTIEERMLDTLAAKHDLALAALDTESEVTEVELRSGIEELKRRLEILLGKQPAAPVDQSVYQEELVAAEANTAAELAVTATAAQQATPLSPPGELDAAAPASAAPADAAAALVEAELVQRRERVAAASGELLGAALQLVGELVPTTASPDPRQVEALQENLSGCMERDSRGRPQLRLTLADDQALQNLAQTLAKLLVTK